MHIRRRWVIGFLALLALCGACTIYLFNLPYYIFPFRIPLIPKDSHIIAETIDQDSLGYSNIEILSASGNGSQNDPRLISVRVMFNAGEVPVPCEGQVFYWAGDPGNIGVRWLTLECVGLSNLIGFAQSSLITPYEPDAIWYPPFYACFNDQIASVLYYWTKKDETVVNQISWPKIKSSVEEMLAGIKDVKPQIALFDPANTEIVDYAPQLPPDQKVRQYYLECDGTVRIYLGQSNLQIYNNLENRESFPLINPLSDENSPD